MKKLVMGVALGILIANTGVAADNRIDGLRPDAPELAAPGDQKIGVRTLQLVHKEQADILNVKAGEPHPTYDRPLTVEVWYPSAENREGGQYENVYIRDGKTKVTLYGKAVRDAKPVKPASPAPLVLISHGYPGNRFLMSHLGENLASKGYVVVSIDHTESTYDNKAAFGSTLVNRALDQNFVLNEIDRLSKQDGHFMKGIVDTSTTGLIGYSMGGYGSVITAGGGVTKASTEYKWGAPDGTLTRMMAGSKEHEALMDDRFKAIISIAPWGMNTGFWDAKGLEGVRVPIFFMAGSVDDVSGYEKGTKAIFENTVNIDRYLLTFENANHNAAAPIPAPAEAWKPSEHLDFVPFAHYADAVWDTLRMNNITQHFATAYFGKYLRADKEMQSYLDLVEDAQKGVYAAEKNGTLKPEHTYWKGFANRTAKGLKLQYLPKK
ncbi:alpha/beta hydrolase family protein [Sneathiella sp.]|jgi:predicted dienelactone hydrolase|uniref:alpha/beta hydrolase family protein n=1 Tax=Sneathiella sp. TaxID=1964365 RepID=UPI0039E221A9